MLTPTKLGTAQWMDFGQVEDNYRHKDGAIWLGQTGSGTGIGYADDRHVCLVSGTRGGKGTTSIINNLIEWPGSVCVIDPKGEDAMVTAARRGKGSRYARGMGQAVHILDPFKVARVDPSLRSRFNPFDALDPDDPQTIDEAARLADAIVIETENTKDPYWGNHARLMIRGLILYILTEERLEGRRNLITLRNLILGGDREAVEKRRQAGEENLPSAQLMLWSDMSTSTAFDGLVGRIGENIFDLTRSDEQFQGVLQMAVTNTDFLDGPGMKECLSSSDFELSQLKTLPQGMSLYLCLPQRFMNTHYRWLRMMIALTTTEMEKVRDKPATGHPVLLLLDEFAGLQRMPVIEKAVAQMAGHGVKMFFVLQTLEQLKAIYKENWETFLANSGLKVFFNIDDNFSREYISKQIGDTEVVKIVHTKSDSIQKTETISEGTTTNKTTGVSGGTNKTRSRGRTISNSVSKSLTKSRNWGSSITETRGTSGPGPLLGVFPRAGDHASNSIAAGSNSGRGEAEQEGNSQSVADQVTEGEGEQQGWSINESDGTNKSTSKALSTGRNTGTNETIQKRPLLSPDEVGRYFARLDDPTQQGYPGLALVLISGQQPIPLIRVEYHADRRFAGLFDPHPDHPFFWGLWFRLLDNVEKEPKRRLLSAAPIIHHCETSVYQLEMSIHLGYLQASTEKQLQIDEWFVDVNARVSAGDAVAGIRFHVPFYKQNMLYVRAPRAGVVSSMPGKEQPTAGKLFTIAYQETELQRLNSSVVGHDPWSDIEAACRAYSGFLGSENKKWKNFAQGAGFVALLFLFFAIAKPFLLLLAAATAGFAIYSWWQQQETDRLRKRRPNLYD